MEASEGSIRRQGVLDVEGETYYYHPLSLIEGSRSLPYSLAILLENALRCSKSDEEAALYAERIMAAAKDGKGGAEIGFMPARVLFQDFTGVPVFVDFAAMREACLALGGDPSRINPLVPCDLVVDHSVIADVAGCPTALEQNEAIEFERNHERYSFLKWAQGSFDNVRIVPPGQGICHQLDIEVLAQVVMAPDEKDEVPVAYFDTVVGTDSHTPTVNGIGVLGWGVGGIEAEAAALGQPITILVPPVVGVHLTGSLPEGTSAMDVSLSFAEMLRGEGVVGCFVECFGDGVNSLSVPQRSCISNMTPEYGCTCTLFPVDERTLEYLELTGRDHEHVALVEAYCKAQGLWNDGSKREYSKVLEFDLSKVARSVAGPSRPHDRNDLEGMHRRFLEICDERQLDRDEKVSVTIDGQTHELGHGDVAIAAITSCTTATDPRMMIASGILARNAAKAGLRTKPWVKTILAPGSKAVELLLERADLVDGLRDLGFYTCGFGCMSCIGNSGPIPEEMQAVSDRIELASVLSGNRNFEGRISPHVSQNYLMAPAAVVAYGLAGTMDIDLEHDALGTDPEGKPVYLHDIWPTEAEIDELLEAHLNGSLYEEGTESLYEGSAAWAALPSADGDLFPWDEASTYVRDAPYFEGMEAQPQPPAPVEDARILALLGDFITTDHISPAGSISEDSPAAQYLKDNGVDPADFNTYGSRRGNHEVLMRGTFGNVKLANKLADGKKGGWTRDHSDGSIRPLYDVACRYKAEDTPTVIIAGKMYGSGSSRDWAAKGPNLLGVRAVIAESFERIHRSNLVGMGILPLQFEEGTDSDTLGIQGDETITIDPIDPSDPATIGGKVAVTATKPDGTEIRFDTIIRIDTPTEVLYYVHGGILPYVIRSLA